MGARGRTSASAAIHTISAVTRPSAPLHLTEEAATEWRRVVDSMPAEWFAPETLALLEQRCNESVWLRRASARLNAITRKANHCPAEAAALLRQIHSQTRMLLQLDTAMRLTQQASYDKAKRKGTTARISKFEPWTEAAE